ncbi:hypothetical protein JTB14_037795 [Gonioctena quinquepunctata]|nr:hypothetical protein JTB14_037795 [Gonioctena quinquepunctata]
MVIREYWPAISHLLKNLGIRSKKNLNVRDDIKMQTTNMETYDKCISELDQHKVPYHIFSKVEMKRSPSHLHRGFAHSTANCKDTPVRRHYADCHESRLHNKDNEKPNKCGNCEGPYEANYRSCPNFPTVEKKEEQKPIRSRRAPKVVEEHQPRIADLLSALEELKELLKSRPILADLIQLKNSQGANNNERRD